MAEQLSLFGDGDPSPSPEFPTPISIPEPLGEELAQLFIQVLARLLAADAEPPR